MEKPILLATRSEEVEREWIDPTVHGKFERIARQHQDRLALKIGEQNFTYSQLNRAANRIAHAILDRLGPGSEPIALLFEHGADIIGAIFGVLKAGKFYTVIDPSLPSDRITHVISDSQAKLIVTNSRNMKLAASQATSGRALLN